MAGGRLYELSENAKTVSSGQVEKATYSGRLVDGHPGPGRKR